MKGIQTIPLHRLITNDEEAYIWKHRIEAIMDRRGLNRWKLGHLTGFSEHTIDNYCKGKRLPCFQFLKALFLKLKVAPEEIFGLTEEDWENREKYHTIYPAPNPAYKHPKRQRPKPYLDSWLPVDTSPESARYRRKRIDVSKLRHLIPST